MIVVFQSGLNFYGGKQGQQGFQRIMFVLLVPFCNERPYKNKSTIVSFGVAKAGHQLEDAIAQSAV
jgi:hypothetical protein